jgi:hypothetical protein
MEKKMKASTNVIVRSIIGNIREVFVADDIELDENWEDLTDEDMEDFEIPIGPITKEDHELNERVLKSARKLIAWFFYKDKMIEADLPYLDRYEWMNMENPPNELP